MIFEPKTRPESKKPPHIGYILQTYPGLTVTFIQREIQALQRCGIDVSTFSVWRPSPAMLSPEMGKLVETTCYIFPLSWPRFAFRHLYFLLTHPGRYLGTALFVLSRPGETWLNRQRTLCHFCEAIHLAWEVKKRNIRHLHAHFAINAASVALIIGRLLDIRFSFTAHNIFFTDRILIKEKLREACFIAVISEYSRDLLLSHADDRNIEEKTYVVHCGIPRNLYLPPSPKLANFVPLIFYVAQLQQRKGAPFLVDACRLLKERGIPFHGVLAGDGPEKPLLEHLVALYDLMDCVDLIGAIFEDKVMAHLQQADIFVLPCIVAQNGDTDGIPVALMEAMACEVAVVSTRVSGIPELVEDGVSGLLVPEKDSLALADALQHLLENNELRMCLGKNGRLKVLREFDSETNAAKLATLFTSHLSA